MNRLSERARIALVAGAGTVAAFFVFGGFGGMSGGSGVDPDAAMPKSAFLFASANVAELRRSPIWAVIFSDKPDTSVLDRRALGLQKLADACGFDPLTRVEKIAVAVPENGDRGDMGVASRVDVTGAELEKCVGGLSGGQAVETTKANGFSIMSSPNNAKVGYGHELLVAGQGKWFDEMLATADGKAPSVKTSEKHAAIRSYLTQQNGWGAPTVVLSAILPTSIRDRIRNEITGEGGDMNPEKSPMAGVLGVNSLGVALKTGAKGGSIEAEAELVCDTDEACAGVEKLLARKRFEWGKELMLRMVGLGPLLDSIAIKRDGKQVLVTAAAPSDQLAATLDRVLRFQASRHGEPEPPRFQPPPPSIKPDEQIVAPKPSH